MKALGRALNLKPHPRNSVFELSGSGSHGWRATGRAAERDARQVIQQLLAAEATVADAAEERAIRVGSASLHLGLDSTN